MSWLGFSASARASFNGINHHKPSAGRTSAEKPLERHSPHSTSWVVRSKARKFSNGNMTSPLIIKAAA